MNPETDRKHIERVLSEEIAQVVSPEQARAVIRKAEQLAGDALVEQRGSEVASESRSAAEAVDAASKTGSPTSQTAQALDAAAAETLASTPDAAMARAATERILSPNAHIAPETKRGLSLLRQAILEGMRAHEALDARAFLAVNSLPHPRGLDRLADRVTVYTNGGWIWIGLSAVAAVLGIPGGKRAVAALTPSLILTTWIVEHPIKSYFRRKRPYIQIVRALVVGHKPGTWSFPSGHTASSFAAAWVLSECWPKGRLSFFAVAAIIGFSRVYVGAHYPGDVLAGATIGVTLAEVTRRLVRCAAPFARLL
ncbi:MAG: phosphatase PAP2 family protein [Chloroflexota bacterium]